MTATMRAARCLTNGPPESVVVEEVPPPVVGPGDVLVAVRAASVNFPDLLQVAGQYQVRVPTPFTVGSELSGVVTAVGSDVSTVQPGDAVLGAAMVGAFAEQISVPASSLHRLPQGMSFTDAAAFYVTHRTAYTALRTVAGVRQGDWVVVLGAAGGVGSAACAIAARLGARTIAVASTVEKRARCQEWGADAAIGYDHLKDGVRAITGPGADIVLDPVGGDAAEAALRSLRSGGRFVTIGFASGVIPRLPLNLVLLKDLTIRGVDLRTMAQQSPELDERDSRELMELAAAGLRPRVEVVYPFDAVADALTFVADRGAVGKVVITIS